MTLNSIESQTAEPALAHRPSVLRLMLRNRLACAAGLVLLCFCAIAVLAPLLAPHPPSAHHPDAIRVPPLSYSHGNLFILGTDALGRDLLSRIIYGSRISIILGVAVVLITLVVGTFLGVLAGYYRGWLDVVLSRVVDVLLAFPFLIFAMAITAATGPNLLALIAALAFKGWVDFFRVARGDTMSARETDYVVAARALGASSSRIMLRHILPNIAAPLIVLSTLRMATIIIAEASLSFLGIGVPPSLPAWGTMVADGRGDIATAWWISTFPGLSILLLVLAVNLLGDALRDALDPRMKS